MVHQLKVNDDRPPRSLKLTWPLKMDGILVSFWDGLFSGAMFVSGRVPQQS